MKKLSQVLALALAALLLVLPAASLAEDTQVHIPASLSKVPGVPSIDDIWQDKVFFLEVRYYDEVIEIGSRSTDYLGRGFECWFTDYHGNAFVPDLAVLRMGRADYTLQVDANGYALVTVDDEEYGNPVFTADKAYADGTSIHIEYNTRWVSDDAMRGPEPPSSGYVIIPGWVSYDVLGSADTTVPAHIEYTLPGVDFFRTGMEGADSCVRYDRNLVLTQCGTEEAPYTHYDEYYSISSVVSAYPAGNMITKVDASWRNDKKTELSGYTISYAPTKKDLYEITYAPQTASILEEHGKGGIKYTEVSSVLPSTKLSDTEFIHHYVEDQVLCGVYYRSGRKYAVSGSGNNLPKWYRPGNGKRVKNVKYPCTFFTSPRVSD